MQPMTGRQITREVTGPPRRGRLAYFVNVYPAVSHTFIRREITALEDGGLEVLRFAIRRPKDLKCPHDKAELALTSYLVPFSPAELLFALAALIRRPLRMLRGLWMATKMAVADNRSFARALLAFPEAAILRRRLARLGVTHVHGHFGTNSAAVLRIVSALSGPGYSFTNHGPDEFDRIHSLSLPDKLREARFVVAISHFARAQIYRWVPEDMWSKIHIVRCALPFGDDDSPPTPVPDTPKLLNVGRLSEEKGQLVLVRAVARLVRESVPVSVVIVGDGPLRSTLEREIEQLKLGDVVKLAGSVPGSVVENLLEESRALVLPSFAEGLPVVLMEAFRAGRPVVATQVAAVAELVEPGLSGWIIPASDEGRLYLGMREVLTLPPEDLTRMGRAGHARVREMHDVRREAEKLAALFATFVDGCPRCCGASRTLATEVRSTA